MPSSEPPGLVRATPTAPAAASRLGTKLSRTEAPESPRRASWARHEPVSADIRTGLCSRAGIPPGKGLARPETGAAFFATLADSGRRRPRDPASPPAKPQKVKDYSGGAVKAELRRSAWWS